MKELKIEIHIRSCAYEELSEEERRLIDAAKEATARSYAPYSRFHVGAAALLANGIIVSGSNQENAAYPSGTCAERTTLQRYGHPMRILLYSNQEIYCLNGVRDLLPLSFEGGFLK